MTEIEKLARKMALAWVNEQRAQAGLKPIKRHTPMWWSMYGREWITKAKAAQNGGKV